VTRVISGGQDGADLAGLIAAKDLGIPTGGAMPLGWRTKSGSHPEYAELYGCHEHSSPSYPPRTKRNVKDSDGTVRFAYNFHTAGERCTATALLAAGKPYFDVTITETSHGVFTIQHSEHQMLRFTQWVIRENVKTLNVAGNGRWEITKLVADFLRKALA
jgi:hypothetical protein